MANRKDSSKRPQAQHKPKSRPSQHDKRKRLGTPNRRRKKTVPPSRSPKRVIEFRNVTFVSLSETGGKTGSGRPPEK